MHFRLIFALTVLCSAVPAAAQGAAQVSEGSSLTLFALGAAGVLLGRRLSMRRKDKDQDGDQAGDSGQD